MALRVEYTTLSHQLAQLDVNKQAGQWARLYRQVQAAEERLRQAEQETPPSQTSPPEFAKQKEGHSSDVGAAPPLAEGAEVDERQERMHAIASDLLYWKGGLLVRELVSGDSYAGTSGAFTTMACMDWSSVQAV